MVRSINLGLLLLPSVRSIAYIDAFYKMGIWPDEIVFLDDQGFTFEELKTEDKKYNYSQDFFNLNIDINSVIEKNTSRIIKVGTKDINHEMVNQALKSCSNEYFVFTGGGILSEKTLALGKSFIHIHSGTIPEFRGSTCFYYSILSNGTLGSTAIILEKDLDSGPVITSSTFNINYFIRQDQPLFFDFIVDSYIRSYTLMKLLKIYSRHNDFPLNRQSGENKNLYYVIHPLLRHLVIEKINNNFDPTGLRGIFEF